MNKCGVISLFGAFGFVISVFSFAISPWLGWPIALCCVAFCGLLLLGEAPNDAELINATSGSPQDIEQKTSQPLVTEQKCRDCEKVKHHTEFARHGTSKTGLRKSCMECVEISRWIDEFIDQVYRYGLSRTRCSLCGEGLVTMAKESDCSAFKVCRGEHASYSRMVCYRVGYERADRSYPRVTHHAACDIALAFPYVTQTTNVLEELSTECKWSAKTPQRVHYLSGNGEIWCEFEYKNMDAEYRTARLDQVTCKRCLRDLS